MKRKIFNNLTELNSQKVYERSPKTRHNINYLDDSNSDRKFKSNEKPKNKEYNNVYKNNSNSKKGKMGKLEYELEPRNILLIPDNFNVKNNNIKICEKELSQKEKNYFISETNFQLIKDALNEKESLINQLQLNKEQNSEKISLLEEENKKFEEANNELIIQIQKNDIYFNKMYKLLEYIFNYYNSFKDPEIKKYIKEQNLEFLLKVINNLQKNQNDNYKNNNKNNEDKDYINEKNYLSKLFDINQDEIMNELEKTKKMYNDIRKQLNYLTNMKSKDNDNQNDINKQLLEYQKKINELNLENQKYMKENTYLKLLCKNLHLEKKVDNIDDNNEIIQELEKQLEEEKNKNANLMKEYEILKNRNESLLKSINILKLDSNKINQENKIINSKFEKIKIEKENLEKQINDRNLKNKKAIYSKKMNLETNKINKSNWKRLKIEQGDKILYTSDKNDEMYNKNKTNFVNNDEQNFDDNNNSNNNFKNMINFDNEIMFNEQMKNVDLLMILYNKSKQTEAFLKNK